MIKTPTPLSRSVTRASPLRKVWPEAQSSRPQSAEEIEVLAQLSDAIKRLRLADSVPLSSTLQTIVCDVGREMDLLESIDKMLLICRAPRSEALLIIMAEVLDLTLKRASSRVASCVDMLQANQALRFCGRSKHADASVFDELDRCLRLCAETAARPAHRPFLLQCGMLPSLYAVLEATRRPWGHNVGLRGRAVEQTCAAIIELAAEDDFASVKGGAPALAVLAELLGSQHEVATRPVPLRLTLAQPRTLPLTLTPTLALALALALTLTLTLTPALALSLSLSLSLSLNSPSPSP